MLKTRLITAVVLILAALAAVLFPSTETFMYMVWGIVFLGAWEWSALAGLKNVAYRLSYVLVFPCVIGLGDRYQMASTWVLSGGLFWVVVACVVCASGAFASGVKRIVNNRFTALLSGWLVLIPWGYSLLFLREYPGTVKLLIANREWHLHGLHLISVIVLIALADSMAYFIGKRWGRYKLAPSISPGKTWEGFLGALIITFALSPGFAMLWTHSKLGAVNPFQPMGRKAAFLSFLFIIMVVFSLVGDLWESLFKRIRHVKDSGNLLPGHGGILDRIDGLTAGLTFLCAVFIGGKYLW